MRTSADKGVAQERIGLSPLVDPCCELEPRNSDTAADSDDREFTAGEHFEHLRAPDSEEARRLEGLRSSGSVDRGALVGGRSPGTRARLVPGPSASPEETTESRLLRPFIAPTLLAHAAVVALLPTAAARCGADTGALRAEVRR